MLAPPFIDVDIYKAVFSYLLRGVMQGVINTALYSKATSVSLDKDIDIQEWSQTVMYKDVVFNTDSTYLYMLRWISLSSYCQNKSGGLWITLVIRFA